MDWNISQRHGSRNTNGGSPKIASFPRMPKNTDDQHHQNFTELALSPENTNGGRSQKKKKTKMVNNNNNEQSTKKLVDDGSTEATLFAENDDERLT
jgi:hypothetical protein